MVGELDGLINEMSVRLSELTNLQEEIKKQSSKKKSMEENINSIIKKEFDGTNLSENKLTKQRYKARLSTLEPLNVQNKKIEDNIKELKNKLNAKYEAFQAEFDRKLGLRKQNFEDFFVLSDEAKERRKEQVKVLEESIKRDEENGVNPDAEYLKNRKKLLENYKASLDEENREKDLDKFIELQKVFKSTDDAKTKINKLNSLVGSYKEQNNKAAEKPAEKPVEKPSENGTPYKRIENNSFVTPKKSIWTKLKEGFIKGWKFIKEYVSGIIKKGKTMLASRNNKQLNAGNSSIIEAHDKNIETEKELSGENKTDFKASLEVKPEAKEGLKDASIPKRDVSNRVKIIKENIAKNENATETEKTEKEEER